MKVISQKSVPAKAFEFEFEFDDEGGLIALIIFLITIIFQLLGLLPNTDTMAP